MAAPPKRRKVEVPDPKATTITITPHSAQNAHALYVAPTVEEGLRRIRNGQTEVILIPKSSTQAQLKAALKEDVGLMFQWYNEVVEPQWQVPSPTVPMLLDPALHIKEWQPYINKGQHANGASPSTVMNFSDGMVNLYGSHTEDLFLQDANVAKVMETMTGTQKT